MIEYKHGDLLAENADALVNTVNCVGVMGRGVALQFKRRFPDNYTFYKTACKHNEVVPGKMLVYETNGLVNPRYIINFPTKRHWRGASRMEDIDAGLTDLIRVVQSLGIASIAVPPLGCGLGGLDWNAVRPRIESAFARLDNVNITLFEPNGVPSAEKTARNREVPKMTNGRAALICLTKQYLDGLLDPIVTLLEIHKLMYFLQESGEPLRLKYVKGPYGPYAANLSPVFNAIEGHLLSGYADGGDKPDKQIQIVPGAETDAGAFLEKQPDTQKRIGRVAELVDGFETPFGMELLATVHWVAAKDAGNNTSEDIINSFYAWSPQKQKFRRQQINIAFERLSNKGWLK